MSSFKASIGEINVICSSLDASLRFYRDVLGFEQLNEEQGCWHMACDGVRFLLLPFAERNEERPAYCSVPAISVDLVVEDLDAARTYLAAKDVDIVDEPHDNDGCFFIRDPDGLVFEVVQAFIECP